MPILVVGGIKPDNMRPWLEAGATASALAAGSTSPASRRRRPRDKARAYVAGAARDEADPDRDHRLRQDRRGPACAGDRRQSAVRAGRDLEPLGPGRRADLHRLARADPHASRGSKRSRSPRRPDRATRSRANASLAGLHCLLEKPPTAGLAEIADLDCLAQAQGVTCSRPGTRSIIRRSMRRPKALAGKRIKSMAIHWHEDVHKWHPGQQWIWEPGGFGVFDPGINAFSIATKIFPGGLFVRVGRRSAFPQNAQTPIAAEIDLLQPGGRRAAHRQPRLAPNRRRGMDDRGRDQPTGSRCASRTAARR